MLTHMIKYHMSHSPKNSSKRHNTPFNLWTVLLGLIVEFLLVVATGIPKIKMIAAKGACDIVLRFDLRTS